MFRMSSVCPLPSLRMRLKASLPSTANEYQSVVPILVLLASTFPGQAPLSSVVVPFVVVQAYNLGDAVEVV